MYIMCLSVCPHRGSPVQCVTTGVVPPAGLLYICISCVCLSSSQISYSVCPYRRCSSCRSVVYMYIMCLSVLIADLLFSVSLQALFLLQVCCIYVYHVSVCLSSSRISCSVCHYRRCSSYRSVVYMYIMCLSVCPHPRSLVQCVTTGVVPPAGLLYICISCVCLSVLIADLLFNVSLQALFLLQVCCIYVYHVSVCPHRGSPVQCVTTGVVPPAGLLYICISCVCLSSSRISCSVCHYRRCSSCRSVV